MEPLFSEKQLQEMSKENMIELLTTMQAHQKKQEKSLKTLRFSAFCELTDSVLGLNDNLWMVLFKSSLRFQG